MHGNRQKCPRSSDETLIIVRRTSLSSRPWDLYTVVGDESAAKTYDNNARNKNIIYAKVVYYDNTGSRTCVLWKCVYRYASYRCGFYYPLHIIMLCIIIVFTSLGCFFFAVRYLDVGHADEPYSRKTNFKLRNKI